LEAPLSKIRDRAWVYMSRVPADGLSSLANPKEFDGLVGHAPGDFGTRQEQMASTGYQMTFCNEFAGETGRFAIGTYVGALDLKAWVAASAKPYAWVEVSSGAQPKKGDILYFFGKHRHLGVAVKVEGGKLYKVEAGQGGSFAKQDFLKWTDTAWPPSDLIGWLDIDLWEYGPDFSESQPDIGGDWTVWGDKRRFQWTYNFNTENATVTWRDVNDGSQHGAGKWRFADGKLKIDWKSGSTDTWDVPIKYDGTKGFEDMKGEGKMDIFATKP
jgi:hypothetical protein